MNSIEQRRILVLDADMVPCLIVSRSLSRRGCRVDVASHTTKPLGSYSRAVERVWQYPDPLSQTDDFLLWLADHTRSQHYDLIIPVTERTLLPLSRSREQFSHVRVAMPEADSLEVVLDKAQTMALAREVGVPVPGGTLVRSMEELAAVEGELNFPVVLKPSRSIGSGDAGASQLHVSYAYDVGGLRAGCAHALRFGALILQEFFAGAGVGIELIACRGEISYAFQHLRLHEVPLSGGGSSLRKSEPVLPDLLEASRKLISALQWNGVAMVEFKLNQETGEFCLMEINGRFWGSLPLADAAGADFPSMLLDLELRGEVVPCEPYRDDIYCRLLSRDLQWYEAVLRNDVDPRITAIPSGAKIVREFPLFFSLRHYFDVQSLRDPIPGLVDLLRIAQTYQQRLLVFVRDRQFLSRQRASWRSGEVAAAIGNAQSVLFLCYGNINRSALADELVRAYAEDSGIAVESAGFHEVTGRPADPVMVEVAKVAGVNLEASRSQCVTPESLNASDVILVMEKAHYDRLVTLSDSVAGKTFLLGAHPNAEGWSTEIADPYGHSRASYEACFERITAAADSLKSFMAVRSSD